MHMKVFTSYFYNIRFFMPWQVPVSTACYDPRWYHAFKSQGHKFLDKRNVLNGLRIECLHPDSTCKGLCHGPEACNCKDPEKCDFLKRYKIQLSKLSKDQILAKLKPLADRLEAKHCHEAEVIFIVHEPPYKACSERKALQAFFNCKEATFK